MSVKYGHGVREYPAGLECFYSVRGHGVQTNDVGEEVVCNVAPEHGCGECRKCGRSEVAGRRAVYGMSHQSRQRLRRALLCIDWGQYVARPRGVAWLTLTFSGDAPDDEEAKRQFDAFRLRFKRKFGSKSGAIWKKEYQRRGVPHYHILVIFPHKGPRDFLTWCVDAWTDITGAPCQSVHLEWVTSWRALATYVARDVGKGSEQTQAPVDRETGEVRPTGRMWGGWNMTRFFGRAVVTYGKERWADARRRITRYVFAVWKRSRPKVKRKCKRWRLSWCFLTRTAELLATCRPPTGPPYEVGIDSVSIAPGRVRVWSYERWNVAARAVA